VTVRWIKQGLLFAPGGQAAWIGTHAALPVVQAVADRQRVYFSSRDTRNRAHIGFVTLSLHQRQGDPQPGIAAVLSPGALGAFDDAGVTSSCLVEHRGRGYLFYTGWTLGVSVPFYLNAGLAVSDDGGETFRRVSDAPLLDRSAVDPFLTASPWVVVENGTWRMWYVSGTGWGDGPNGPTHRYHIKYAESSDGVTWKRNGVVAIDYASPSEYAFGRPCIVYDAGLYRMWYSYRGAAYRIGYAESPDGIAWTRKDNESVIGVSKTGWDSDMVTYPHVFKLDDRWQMVYNGNGYGRTGIGLATST
jgi:hypothetical protein